MPIRRRDEFGQLQFYRLILVLKAKISRGHPYNGRKVAHLRVLTSAHESAVFLYTNILS